LWRIVSVIFKAASSQTCPSLFATVGAAASRGLEGAASDSFTVLLKNEMRDNAFNRPVFGFRPHKTELLGESGLVQSVFAIYPGD
jgi:hypothetical protein